MAAAASVVLTARKSPPTQQHACLAVALVSPFAAPLPVNSTGFFPNVSAGRHFRSICCVLARKCYFYRETFIGYLWKGLKIAVTPQSSDTRFFPFCMRISGFDVERVTLLWNFNTGNINIPRDAKSFFYLNCVYDAWCQTNDGVFLTYKLRHRII